MAEDKTRKIIQDVSQVSNDIEELMDDVAEEVEHIAEQAAGAEFLGATDLIESIGIYTEAITKAGDIWREQIEYAVTDWQQAASKMTEARQPTDLLSTTAQYWQQRYQHVLEGNMAWWDLLSTEQQKLTQTHKELWGVFQKSHQ